MAEIRKLATDNPILDEIVYQCQRMISGIVMKNEERALAEETVASRKEFGMYQIIVEGKDSFEYHKYDAEILRQIPSINPDQMYLMVRDNKRIPNAIRPECMRLAENRFLKRYEELNNYYRMLNGLPDIGDTPIRLTRDQCKRMNDDLFDYSKSIDEMTPDEIELLKMKGILDEILSEHPEKEYLKHLGDAKIDPYMARKAPNFSVLYMPSCDSMEVYRKFADRLAINRELVVQSLYSDAYRMNSEYYDNFIMMMIIIMSFDDMITMSPEYIITRDLFDLRTIQMIFEASGVTYFQEIPIKYQKRLVKNLNRLIKFSASEKNFIDIASLFGFENIQLFKYYILRQPLITESGQYYQNTKLDPDTGEEVDDTASNYELKFVRVPINSNIDDHMREDNNYIDYDTVVKGDRYWDGVYDHDFVKKEILSHEFNFLVTKYIAIDTVYSMTDMSFELVYFINMLLYSGIDMSELRVPLPELNSTMEFSITDLFISLYALKYIYYGYKDNIIYDPVNVLDIKGFNFQANMDRISEYLYEKGYTTADLRIDGFMIPDGKMLSFDQLMNVYFTNTNIREHVINEINNAETKEMYDIYMYIYDALMVSKLSYTFFRDAGGGSLPKTYTDYLAGTSSYLYNKIMDCKAISQKEERERQVSELINIIIDNIGIFINDDQFRYIFQDIPTASMDYIKGYMFKVLNFFKSYKVDFIGSNDVFYFDDIIENRLHILDQVRMKMKLNVQDILPIEDYLWYFMKYDISDGVEFRDKVWIYPRQ